MRYCSLLRATFGTLRRFWHPKCQSPAEGSAGMRHEQATFPCHVGAHRLFLMCPHLLESRAWCSCSAHLACLGCPDWFCANNGSLRGGLVASWVLPPRVFMPAPPSAPWPDSSQDVSSTLNHPQSHSPKRSRWCIGKLQQGPLRLFMSWWLEWPRTGRIGSGCIAW